RAVLAAEPAVVFEEPLVLVGLARALRRVVALGLDRLVEGVLAADAVAGGLEPGGGRLELLLGGELGELLGLRLVAGRLRLGLELLLGDERPGRVALGAVEVAERLVEVPAVPAPELVEERLGVLRVERLQHLVGGVLLVVDDAVGLLELERRDLGPVALGEEARLLGVVVAEELGDAGPGE